jgi:hypothetical protein
MGISLHVVAINPRVNSYSKVLNRKMGGSPVSVCRIWKKNINFPFRETNHGSSVAPFVVYSIY